MAYNAAQLQQILRQAGWPENLLVIMAAVGLAESGGNPTIRNPNLARENSIGLWQINRYAHPQYPESSLRDPLYNAQAALDVYRLQGLRAWGAYTDGRYRKYLAQSQTAYNQSRNTLPNVLPTVATTTANVNTNPVIPFPGEVNFGSYAVEDLATGTGIDTSTLLLLAGAGILTIYLISR